MEEARKNRYGMGRQKTSSSEETRKTKTLYTLTLNEDQLKLLEQWCKGQMWEAYAVAYARFAFHGNHVNVVGYQSGKVVVQGKKTEDFVTYVLEPEITRVPQLGFEKLHHPEWFVAHAGMDESGKGDFFGPLVTACVIADEDSVNFWLEAGLRESKKVSGDQNIFKMEKIVRQAKGVIVETAFARMEKYNALYEQFGNLNELLAWFHARSLESALKKRWVKEGMLDQFAKGCLVQKYFKDPAFQLKQKVRAEEDPVVAAASIVARAEFLRQLKQLSDCAGITLVKGAGPQVKFLAQTLIKTFGLDQLGRFAKLHFKTAQNL